MTLGPSVNGSFVLARRLRTKGLYEYKLRSSAAWELAMAVDGHDIDQVLD